MTQTRAFPPKYCPPSRMFSGYPSHPHVPRFRFHSSTSHDRHKIPVPFCVSPFPTLPPFAVRPTRCLWLPLLISSLTNIIFSLLQAMYIPPSPPSPLDRVPPQISPDHHALLFSVRTFRITKSNPHTHKGRNDTLVELKLLGFIPTECSAS